MPDRKVLKVRRVRPDADRDIPLPCRMSPKAAGLDVHAAVESELRVPPGGIVQVPTGLAVELPEGHEAQIRPRSGLAAGHGVTLLNSPGTIDEDYRGEIRVLMVNLGTKAFTITRGMRIAQLVVAPVTYCDVVECEQLSDTARGNGGFGSTGS